MKKRILLLVLCGLTLIAKSQSASVEQSTYEIQTGFLGIWAHKEQKSGWMLDFGEEVFIRKMDI